MLRKMLVAIDGSDSSLKALEYVGRQFSGVSSLEVTLLHVIPYPPAPFWDQGHIPSEAEQEERKRATERWLLDQREKTQSLFDRATDILADEGISKTQMTIKTISDSSDVADTILEETKDGGYQTLVLGRRGLSGVMKLVVGSVTQKIINHGAGVAVCVVE
jgi:nucleotide-binding universal stress UspA family protein